MVTKVTAENIQDKITTGDKAAALINDNKRAINQVIDAKEESLGNPVNDGRVLTSTAAGVRSWVDVGRSRTFKSLTDAVDYVTLNPETLDQVTTVSDKSEAECISLGVDYPDGNGGDYIVVEGESLIVGEVIAAGVKQLKLITQRYGLVGTAASKDTGTEAGQVPLNSDLGSASKVDTGSAPEQVPLNSNLGSASKIDTGTNFDQVPLNTNIVYPVDTVADLRLLEPAVDGQQFNLLEYHAGTGLGGGTLYYDATDTTSVDDGIEVFVTSSGARIKRAGAELKTLDNAGSAQHSKNAKNRSGVGVSNERTHIIAGIDSLTQGYFTGDDFGYGPVHSHFSEFIKLATNTLGNSGGYFSIVSEQSARFGAEIGAGSGFTSLKGIDASDMRRRMSFDFNGLAYSSAKWVPNKSIYWTSNRNWNKQRLFFLRQFNGGTFEVDHISEVSYRYSIDTGKASAGLGLGDSATDLLSGEYELDYIDIDRLAGASDQMKLRYVADGEICVYGVFTDDLKGNCKYTYQSNSGYKVADYVSELDGTTLERWYQILEPSHYMLNGGTNDRKSSTVSEFEVNYAELIRRIMAGSAAGSNSITSDILCISPNDLSDKGLIREFRKSIYSIATNNGYGYLDHMQVLGTFEDADTLGLMRDGTHPGYAGIPPLALADCSYFGISAGKYAFADSYQAGTGELFEFSGELRSVATGQITAGNSVEIYNIGLRDVTDFITFNLSVTGQRTGQDLFRNKSLDFAIRNSGVGTSNEVTFLLAGTATETLGNAAAIDFTISTSIVSDRLVVSIDCTGNIQNFSARANWFGRAYYVGDVVFENDVSDLSLVTYSGESDD